MADNATMRDRGLFWRPVPEWGDAQVGGDGWTARRVSGLGQTLISGKVESAVAELAPGAAEVGLWEFAEADTVLVRIARDKALLVAPTRLDVEPGWRSGYVATPADDAWAVFELTGEGVPGLVAQATSTDIETGSRSASVMFAGVPLLLYRTAPDVARLHVEAPLATYLWTWLEGAD